MIINGVYFEKSENCHFPWMFAEAAETTSTIDWIKQNIINSGVYPMANYMVLRADQQTKGIGQYGRFWHSPRGGLYASILLKHRYLIGRHGLFCLFLAVILAQIMRNKLQDNANIDGKQHYTAKDIRLKWPNDILLGGKKLAGLLCHATDDSTVVMGLGCNLAAVALPDAENTSQTKNRAIGLNEAGIDITPQELLKEFIKNLDARLMHDWAKPAINEWQEIGPDLNAKLTVLDGNKRITGVYQGLAADGGLKLKTSAGQKILYSGAVES